ncbi:hypothetical protein HDC92_004340 [Pedobacter sp. AK017]|uniref:DUF4134 family protein n=1 Tax=Pedobacter sp. AK017 TaxID=2723073 RepID=UPI001619CDB4|nr:DUF4134 family protein [Pedobacter sp. AK017]MBB5440637.1 hypothetical protein [Pedobacter sp. AK017]
MKTTVPFLKAAQAAFLLSIPAAAAAQPGISEFYQASGQITRMYFSMSDMVLVLGAIAGLIGGLRVFHNWQFGKQHIDSQVAGWLLACLFLSLLSVALSALFGIH